jgi:hypothetical protein
VPAIRIFQQGGKIYTLDNRRLVAFQKAGVRISYRIASENEVNAFFKNASNSFSRIIRGGRAIRIRGTGEIWSVVEERAVVSPPGIGTRLSDDGGGSAISRGAILGCGECKDKPF